jgi:ATP-dependent helicase/nuclease subunit A
MPGVVRLPRDLPGGAAVTRWNPEQRDAIERAGSVFVSAGAGTGKTAVLVERVLRRALGGTPLDHLLVITFTERAASELKRRVRGELELRGERERAREVDGAWISTIHRFCLRVLRGEAFAAGLDPRFTVADETQSRILRSDAFDAALERFVAADEPRRIDLLAGYGRERLRELLTEAYARVRSAGLPIALVPYAPPDLAGAVAAARRAAAAVADREEAAGLLSFLDSGPDAAALADLSAYRVRNVARYKELNAAREAVEAAARDVAADADRALLEELLRLFAAAYAAAKDARSLVDFDDLELRARDLLRARPELAEAYRAQFAEVMVDEFQDTNRLQCELVDLVAGQDLFLVGDEFQSIYRFRHADVEVYKERRRAAGPDAVSLVRNYRSRPHVLAAVNELFRREFGARYTPLVAEGAFAGAAPPAGGRVELLLTDKEGYRAAGTSWREAEAAALADRIAGLVSAGEALPGQVVVLFEAGTDAARYEAALRARHLRTVRTTGRGYYAQGEVADLVAYLRLLQNRYDDVALLSVLASPLVGMSNDGLYLLRASVPKRPIFTAFERDELPVGLGDGDGRLAQAFLHRFGRLVAASATVGLEALCELVVTEHDYDLACLAQRDGDRRFANVRKLQRLAREFESLRGPDLEGFIRFCAEQAAMPVGEGEAAIAEEGADAVVLMTVHAAKGLEFDVVAIADCGRERGSRRVGDIVCTPSGAVALRAPDPVTGALRPALGWDAVRRLEAAAEAEEGRRLQYVAMTRARHHLLVSGAYAPGEDTAIARLCELFQVGLADEGEPDRGEARLRVHVDRPSERAPAPPPRVSGGDEVGRQLALFDQGGRAVAALAPLEPPPAPPDVPLRSLSYSALALWERCPYRFFAQRVLRLPERPAPRRDGEEGLTGMQLGDVVHVLLERGAVDVAARYPHATVADRERIDRLAAAWRESQFGSEVAALHGARRELPWAFALDGVLFHGRFDLYQRDGSRALVVDYKTNLLGDEPAADVVERAYRLQVTLYALAALRAEPDVECVEVAYAFLGETVELVRRTYGRDDEPALVAEVAMAVAAVREGRFPPRPGEHCADCPALDLVCAGPRLPVGARAE